MHELNKKIQDLSEELTSAWAKLDLDQKIARAKKLEAAVSKPEIWSDPDHARKQHEALSALNNEITPWKLLKTQLHDLDELVALSDEELTQEITEQINALEQNLTQLKKSLRFTGKYDRLHAILRITAGVGGTEAMDWAGMLERMYLRFCDQQKFKTTCLERTTGEEAGIKTGVYEITGTNVYGTLKSEHGVHRLVRLSPFNADNLRQTSFALVEVLPVIENETDLELDPKDLRIDVYRSGGHGGQSVNTTDSAVRITHLPTNTVVAIQNERSQVKNKAKAMEVLRGKLAQMQQEQQAASISDLRASESAKWGQQIRNYILHPYQLVKDTRTKHETANTAAVLDGEINEFIEAFLEG